mgnify:CR=1 FL=1|jgi:hypothetical protein
MPRERFVRQAIKVAQGNWIGNRPVPARGVEIVILNPATELCAGIVKINTLRGAAPGTTSEPFNASGHGYGMKFPNELTLQKSVHWRDEPK